MSNNESISRGSGSNASSSATAVDSNASVLNELKQGKKVRLVYKNQDGNELQEEGYIFVIDTYIGFVILKGNFLIISFVFVFVLTSNSIKYINMNIVDKSNDGQDNYSCVKTSSIMDVKNLESAAAAVKGNGSFMVSFNPNYDENAIKQREADAIARAELIHKRFGADVSKEALYLFEQLSKTWVLHYSSFC